MTSAHDVIVIGAGHNGLVCAAYLAKAGRDVLVLEAREHAGGMAATQNIGEGYNLPGLVSWGTPIEPKIVRDLKLKQSGFGTGPAIDTLLLDPNGQHCVLGHTEASGDGLSDKDGAAYRAFKARHREFAAALETLWTNRPPRLKNMGLSDLATLGKSALKIRFGLGADAMQELLRVAGINIYDVLNDEFDDARIKSALAVDAVMGHHMGPRTPGTVFTYLAKMLAERHGPITASADSRSRVCDALMNSAENFGASIRTGAPVARICIKNGKATGVELEDGELIASRCVVSNADAQSTLLCLVGAQSLDAMFAKRVAQVRCAGDVAKLQIALNGLPEFPGLSEQQRRHRLVIAPSIDDIERAFNYSKYGEYSPSPIIDMVIPSLTDNSLAPEGHHVASVSAMYAPRQLNDGWSQHRNEFAWRVIAEIDRLLPGFKSCVVDHRLLTPEDIEKEYLVTGGHWHHAEMTLHQSLMLRPVHGAAQYETPIDNLYLCGAACHPGGGLTGLPGHNAAKTLLANGAGA